MVAPPPIHLRLQLPIPGEVVESLYIPLKPALVSLPWSFREIYKSNKA
jgi:hypothetical protein